MNHAADDIVGATATAVSLMLPFLAALANTVLVALVLIPIARRTGWTDKPDARKQHNGEIPLVGGAAILAATLLTTGLFWSRGEVAAGLTAAMVILFCVGLVDDLWPIRARYRFLAQLVAAAMVVFIDKAVVLGLGDCCLGGMSELELIAIPFTIIAITGLINAYNMSDGLDGLCGGYGLIAAAWFCVALLLTPAGTLTELLAKAGPILVPLIGALIGFLLLNARLPWQPRALIFLGDSGSMMLGCVIGWVAITLSQPYDGLHLPPASVAWIVAVPVLDMISCIARRISEGKTPMSADRRHLHHLLIARGRTPESAVRLLHLIALLSGGIGVLGWVLGLPEPLSFALFIATILVSSASIIRFWRRVEARNDTIVQQARRRDKDARLESVRMARSQRTL